MYDDNLFAVDTTGVQEMGGYELFPAGLYPAMMVTAAKKPTRNNDGAFLECVYQIMEGDFTGKKFTSRLNLWNQNDQAVGIAKRELKSLRIAIGVHDQESRTTEFLNKGLILNIGVKARKDKPAEAENNLISIEPYGQHQQPTQPAQTQMPFAQPQQQPMFQPPQSYQTGAVGAPAQSFGQRTQQPMQPQQPAFTPNAAKPPPWMAAR